MAFVTSFATAHLMGGLGNQLFQVAAAYAYAKRQNKSPIFLLTWPTHPDRPPIWNTYLNPAEWTLIGACIPHRRISEQGFAFQELPASQGQESVELYGYFQSSKYFSLYADEVRARLQVSPRLLELYPVPSHFIGAHVRRGDYMKNPDFHHVCTKEYYNGAREYIDLKKPVYWITDDPEWVTDTLYREGDMVVSSETVADFTRLSQFQDLILSNSSFSWWAAWLNPCGFLGAERTICCPDKWFGPSGPQEYQDIYEPGWSKIDTISGKVVAQA
jgi:hypothetical protein